MKQHIDKIEEIIDQEIEIYEKIEQCVIDKKQIIMKRNDDLLKDVDAKLAEYASVAAHLSQIRQQESLALGTFQLTFDELTQKAKEYDLTQSQRLAEKKSIMKKITNSIQKANLINAKLIQNALLIMEKTVGIIVKTALPEADSYNNSGRMNKVTTNYKMSSISTEA